jgi:hypothetical protein
MAKRTVHIEQVETPSRGERVNLRAGNVLILCATCAYYVDDGRVVETSMQIGNCRRNAPVEQVGWPQVHALDFCGQHRLATKP